jgi:hypothetical protein
MAEALYQAPNHVTVEPAQSGVAAADRSQYCQRGVGRLRACGQTLGCGRDAGKALLDGVPAKTVARKLGSCETTEVALYSVDVAVDAGEEPLAGTRTGHRGSLEIVMARS